MKRRNGATKVSRRSILERSFKVGVGVAVLSAGELPIVEADVLVQTSDGACDAVLFHPRQGAHPGILLWPDSGGLREAFRELGRRVAAQGYTVLVPNHLYRSARPPIFPADFDPPKKPADMETYRRITASFFAAGAIERDAVAYAAFLDARPEVKKRKKLGVIGYCLGGMCVIRTAAALPGRIGAGASLHGGPLVTSHPDSPHLVAPKIKARLYFAIASDDDQQGPDVKNELRSAFASAKVRAEVDVYPDALHGWCVPGSKAASNTFAAELA